MKELQFLNYYTVCSYSRIDADGNATTVLDHDIWACFRNVFDIIRKHQIAPKAEYRVFVATDRGCLNEKRSNYCFLNKQGILRHLKQLQEVVPEVCSYDVVPANFGNAQGYEVVVVINPAAIIIHKYALTWIRLLYEPTGSLALLDVTRMAKLSKFKFVSYENLLNVTQACFTYTYPKHNTGHSIGYLRPHKFLTKKELRRTIREKTSLNTIYEMASSVKSYEQLPDYEERYDLAFWESDEEFVNKRLPYYEKMFDKIKRHGR